MSDNVSVFSEVLATTDFAVVTDDSLHSLSL